MRDISKLKALLDISAEDESRDELLSFLLDSAERYALSYCRLPALGDELECVAVEMAAQDYGALGGFVRGMSLVSDNARYTVCSARCVGRLWVMALERIMFEGDGNA